LFADQNLRSVYGIFGSYMIYEKTVTFMNNELNELWHETDE